MAKSPFNIVFEVAKQQNGRVQQTIKDLVQIVKNELKANFEKGLYFGKKLKEFFDIQLKETDNDLIPFYYDMYFNLLVAESPYSLDSYFQALEWNRPLEERFYLPRRKQLMDIVQALEDLLIYDRINELFLSQPPRTGKSTLILFVVSWLIGKDSEKANLYSSAGEALVSTFYTGLTEILNDEVTYCWHIIFPNAKWDKNTLANAKDTYLDIDRKKRYHSFTCRSIDSKSLNGACDCNGVLIADDLCSDIEVAINKDRLYALNLKVRNNLLTRAKMGAKYLWIGTRWSLADPIGVRIESLENTKRRYKIIAKPALNENGESNFDYLYGVGFSTDYYQDIKQTFVDKDDIASWEAQYMQNPVERTGLLFPSDSLRFYNGTLPSGEPDRKFAFCDPAWGGGDYTAFPVLYQYGKVFYCVDMVCDPGDKNITQPKVANMIVKHQLSAVRFEKNNGGGSYKDNIEKRLIDENDYRCNMTVTSADNTTQKEYKIWDRAPEIREIFFLETAKRDRDYRRGMEQLMSFSMNKKVKHDDLADALVGCLDMAKEVKRSVEIEIIERVF